MSLRFAYNTNGMGSHRLSDALTLIAEADYDGVALTLDHCHFDPFDENWYRNAERLRRDLERMNLGSVVETGARFLLDPRAKHEPTLVTASADGRARRVAFLKRAIDIAAILGSEAVSFWAGILKTGFEQEIAWQVLREGLEDVANYAKAKGVVAALEPEPGMLVETVDDYKRLAAVVLDLTLALDLGHCLVTGEREPAAAVAEFAGSLGTVAIEDMKRGEHIHLPFGEGDMNIASCLAALNKIRFSSLVCVELSRDGHRADVMVTQALSALRAYERMAVAA